MAGPERIVHVVVAIGGQSRGEFGIALFLARMKAQILQQHDVSGLHVFDQDVGAGSDHVAGHAHAIVGQEFLQMVTDGGQAEAMVVFPLGAAQMGHKHQPRAPLGQPGDGGKGCADAGVIGDEAMLIQRHVEIHPHQHATPFRVQIPHGFLVHGSLHARRPRRSAQTSEVSGIKRLCRR